MADVSVWGGVLRTTATPASGTLMVGDGANFAVTQSNITFGNPVTITVPLTVNGQVWSTTGGIKFPDNTIQTSAATSYIPPSVATGTVQSNISGSSNPPSANTISSVLDNLFGTTQGNVVYRGASSWAALAPGTSGQFLQTQGTGANPQWASVTAPPWTIVKKTSDQTITSSTTLVNDTQLFFTAAANTTYAVQCVYSLSMTSGIGFKVGITGPASPTRVRATSFITGGTFTQGGEITAYGTIVSNTTGGPSFVYISMIIINGPTAGTVTMQIAQAASSASSTVFEQGSYLQYATF